MEKQPEPEPTPTSPRKAILKNGWRMFTYYPVWDLAWVVACVYTIGSLIFVLTSILALLPGILPDVESPNQALYSVGILSFIGIATFELGAFLLVVQAFNESHTGCFGHAVRQLFRKSTEDQDLKLRSTDGKTTSKALGVEASLVQDIEEKGGCNDDGKHWVWLPPWSELRSHYCELGFVAAFAQLVGTSIYFISAFTGLPGILNRLSQPVENAIYWTPQVIGSIGFILSGLLTMLMYQQKWYKPALKVLGWHIGLWSFIGGVGFHISPIFGYNPARWSQLQAGLSILWGSCAFVIASLMQVYASVQETPA